MGANGAAQATRADQRAAMPPAAPWRRAGALPPVPLTPVPLSPAITLQRHLAAAFVPPRRPLRTVPTGRLAVRLAALDIATDLGRDIGAARWWRGAAVLAGGIGLALGLAPWPAPLAAAPAMRIDAAAREALAEQAVMPQALGGDVGSRMGPALAVVPMAAVPPRPRIVLTGRFDAALGLAGALVRSGVGNGDAMRAAAVVARGLAGGLVTGTPLGVTLGARPADAGPRPLERLAIRARFDLALDLVRAGGDFRLARRAIPVDATPLRIRGTVGSSLFMSAVAAGAPPAAIRQYLQAVDQTIGLDAVHPGDTFDLVLAWQRAAGGETAAGPLLYAGLDSPEGTHARLVRWAGAFVDPAAPAAARAGLVMPVAGARVTSGFGMRFHPILGYTRMHQGIDLAAPWGSPIRAVADGVVEWAGPHGGHGNFVRIDHVGGMGSGYAHMSRVAVATGERVHAGEVIGFVGSTGLSTGPHLHFEVYRDGQVVDPGSAHFVANAGLDPRDRAVLRARLAALLLVPPGAALRPIAGGVR